MKVARAKGRARKVDGVADEGVAAVGDGSVRDRRRAPADRRASERQTASMGRATTSSMGTTTTTTPMTPSIGTGTTSTPMTGMMTVSILNAPGAARR